MAWRRPVAIGVLAAIAAASAAVWFEAPAVAANALLRPVRRPLTAAPPPGCVDVAFQGAGVTLRGWRCGSTADARATVILLHGMADNRASWRGAIDRLTAQRFEVVAYDGRAHGQSDGDVCTYGFLEKQDLRRVVDVLGALRYLTSDVIRRAFARAEADGGFVVDDVNPAVASDCGVDQRNARLKPSRSSEQQDPYWIVHR